MQKQKIEHAIIIKNSTRMEQLIARFNTQTQAEFYIVQSQKKFYQSKASFKNNPDKSADEAATADFKQYEDEHKRFYKSLGSVQKQLESVLKTKIIEQNFLSSYIFTPKDLVVVVGQDGLVANTAKYVNNIPIVAINPDPTRYDGVLLPFHTNSFMSAVHQVIAGNYDTESISMAEVRLNDGQRLLAFNDLFIGPSKHNSARYKISYRQGSEQQSSSGIIVSTGAGATGWLSSLFNMANGMALAFQGNRVLDRLAISREEEKLVFVVREPFLSKTSQIGISAGIIEGDERLTIESYMPQEGVIFSDGIQADFLQFNSGAIAEIGIAPEKALLVQ